MTGGSDRLPLNCFHLRGANASQLGAISGGPSLGRASCSQGTDAVTTSASPSTDPSHAPRAKSGVCASPVDSASGTSRSFFGQHVRVVTSRTSPENPQARFSCQGTPNKCTTVEHVLIGTCSFGREFLPAGSNFFIPRMNDGG